jgi:predicted ATPase/transcriptional regulator with XRE-family HTH domain
MADSGELRFGAILRRFRRSAGLTQEALAERARLSVEAVSTLERGTRRAPFAQTLALLAQALELTSADRAIFESAATQARRSEAIAGERSGDHNGRLPANNLPVVLSRTIGRESVLPIVGGLLAEGRLLTIVGTGGVGKTRIALLEAWTNLAAYRDGAWFVDLAPLRDGRLVAGTVAQSIALEHRGTTFESLTNALRERELLVVLDNCEHVIAEAARVAEHLLRAGPRVKVVATSRERLNVEGEQVYRLPSLSTPPPGYDITPEELPTYGACALFAARAQASDDRFEIRAESAPAIGQICRRLDGIPLAVELAAARIRVFSPAQLATRLDERFAILTHGNRTALPRQQTMRATIDWSYDLLTEPERMLLRRVSVFAGGWTLDAALGVCATDPLDENAVVEVLTSLVEKSLVVAELEVADGRYRLLESTHAYALEKLVASGERQTLAQRHATWMAGLTIGFRKAYYSLPRERWLAQLGPEIDNIRAALTYASEAKNNAAVAGRILWLARVTNALSIDEPKPKS